MNKPDKNPRGRPLIPEELRSATIKIATAISERSGLKPAEIEKILKINSTPPGNNWRRYLRGDRTMNKETRWKIARVAKSKGWLPEQLSGFVSIDEMKSFGWAINGRPLGSLIEEEKRLHDQQKKMNKLAHKCLQSIQELEKNLIGEEDYWGVYHPDYTGDPQSPDADEFFSFHQYDFEKELEKIREKIASISFNYIDHANHLKVP